MPSGASTCWYARRCRYSLSAITPSKSKTIACRARSGMVHALARANGGVEPVLFRRIGAVELRTVIAVRVVGDIEVDDVDAGRRGIELHVAAGRIRLGAAGLIGERHEQPIGLRRLDVDECRQPHRLALQRELERADALDVADLARRGRHLDAGSLRHRLEARRHGIVLVDRVVDERQQRRLLVRGNRGRGIVLEAIVLGGADGFDLGGVVFLFRPQRTRRGRNCEDDRERLTKHIFTITCPIRFLGSWGSCRSCSSCNLNRRNARNLRNLRNLRISSMSRYAWLLVIPVAIAAAYLALLFVAQRSMLFPMP